jgi:RHS repeat-associated protein
MALTKSYLWNPRDHLIALGGDTSASFSYDGLGRRLARTVDGLPIAYLHDNAEPVSEIVGGITTATILLSDINDEHLMRSDTVDERILLSDAIGSVIGEADASGAAVTTYTYEPFGWSRVSGIAPVSTTRYSGRPDDGTGLFYHRARYYHPVYARFISEDPMGLDAGMNVYEYVGSSPINFVDTDGLYKTKNLPPEKSADVDAAMALLRQKLTDSCCAGKKGRKLLDKANDPNLLLEYKPKSRLCGRTGFWGVMGVQNKVEISPLAWNCCADGNLAGTVSLASTILHELKHQGFGRERSSEDIERKCFGCTKR